MIEELPENPSTVIIVSDAMELSGPLVVLLESAGFKTINAYNEESVGEQIKSPEAEAIIIALSTDEEDSLHVCRWLKSKLNTHRVPILLARTQPSINQQTTNPSGEILDFDAEARKAGAADVLHDLTAREEVLGKVARLTERYRAEHHAGYPEVQREKPAEPEQAETDGAENKLMSRALSGASDPYRLLFESSPLPMWVYDLETLAFLAVNEAAIRHYGYTQEEFLLMTIRDIRPEEDVQALLEKIKRLVPSLNMTGTWRHRRKNGELIDVQITSHEVVFARRRARLVLAHDITERRQVEAALAQQVEREALVNRISSAVRLSLDPAEVFRTAVNELGTHLHVDRCTLFVLDDKQGVVRGVAQYSAPGIGPAGTQYSVTILPELIENIRRNGVLAFDDVENDPRLKTVYEEILRPLGVRSVLYVAIRVGEEIPAAFAFSTIGELRNWPESDIALAKAVAIQTGIAIRQAELYQKAEATSAREAMINRLSHAIRASLSLPEVLNAATQELGLALQASRVSIFPYDPTGAPARIKHEYVAPHATSIRHIEITYNDPVGEYLFQTLEPLVVNNAAEYVGSTDELTNYMRRRAKELGFLSRVTCPLVVDGSFRGALSVQQTDRVRHWSEDEIALIKAVAAQLATGIKQAELFEMVVRAKEEWETTFNAMSDGVFIFNEDGVLVRVNRAGASFEDAQPEELVGRSCCEILHTTPSECIITLCLSEGRRLTDELRPERAERSLLFTAEPIMAGDGRVAGAVCSVRDLSELRKIEAVAREHQSLLRSVLDSAREAIYALDTKGRVQWCNRGVSTMGGYVPEDLIGHHFLEWAIPNEYDELKDRFERALCGEAQSYEMSYQGADGQIRYALVNNTPLIIDGRTTGVLGIMRDITEQRIERQRAAQAEKLRALGQLASGVAHDFNNALAAIIGRAQLLGRLIQDGTLATHLDVIQTAAADAAETVRRIQTFARQPRMKEFELLNVASLLRDAIELTRTRWETEARARELRYEVDLDVDSDVYLEGSASELREVFVNLIVNALDAMPKGGSILIICRRTNERVQILFTDTGAGMSDEVRERVFEPFYTTKGAQGTGLGLFVSYGIIERHRGVVSVESEPGRGTTFILDLPAIEASHWTNSESLNRASENMLSILVVDDEQYVRETLAEMISVLAHRVVKADGGKAALAAVVAEPFDLVFVDLSMPAMDGWDVAREIRRTQPEARIILTTGYGQDIYTPTDKEKLVDAIIEKPFDFAQVADAIAQTTSHIQVRLSKTDIKQKAG